jgi:hypothetical protein
LTTNKDTESNLSLTCKALRDKAYSAAHALRIAAFNTAVIVAKDVYTVATDAATKAAAAAAAAKAQKVEEIRTEAAVNAKYIADHAYALAEEVYKTAIDKADAEYISCLLAK